MNNFYVYQYIRSKNSKHGPECSPYYIGKGKDKRAWGSNHNIKPPKDKSKIIILSENMSEVDAFQAEILLIYLHGRIDKGTGCLWNMTDGGDGCSGRPCSDRTKAKIRNANKGRPNPITAARNKASKGKPKKPLSEEHKIKLSIMKKGNKAALGFKHSIESRERMSRIQKSIPKIKLTHCKRGHEFTVENSYYRPDGMGRQCLTCIKQRKKKYRNKHKMSVIAGDN